MGRREGREGREGTLSQRDDGEEQWEGNRGMEEEGWEDSKKFIETQKILKHLAENVIVHTSGHRWRSC